MDKIPFTLLRIGFMMEHCRENENLGLFLDQFDEDGHKSLRAACNKVRSHESVRPLVEAKAKLDGRDGAGYTTLDTCKQFPAEPVVENNLEFFKDKHCEVWTSPAWHVWLVSTKLWRANDGDHISSGSG